MGNSKDDIEVVTPLNVTGEEASSMIFDYISKHPDSDACDIAEALNLPIQLVLELADELMDDNKIFISQEVIQQLKDWVNEKQKKEQKVVDDEYEFWKIIDSWADGNDN